MTKGNRKYKTKKSKAKHSGYITNLYCIRKEKKRLFSKMVLYAMKDIDSLIDLPQINNEDHFFEPSCNSKDSYFDSEYYYNNITMTKGYASAALFFLKIISSSDSKHLRACYIAPCLFCFRHYIELSLKDTLWCYHSCGYEVDLEKINDEHNLSVLWDTLVPYLKRDDKTKNVSRLLHEISDFDKNGATFRYSYHFTQKERKLNNPLNISISSKSLYTRMLQIYIFLEGINLEISNGLDEISSYNN